MARAVQHWAGILATCGLAMGCGAKTGLTVPCSVEVVTTKPEIVLVLDRSGSMTEATRDGIPLIDAVRNATNRVLPQFSDAGELALVMFPASDDSFCGGPASFQVQLAPQTTTSITREIQRTSTFGLTPTYSALSIAAAELRRRATDNPGRHRFIVLVTDGGAQCNDAIDFRSCACTVDRAACERPGGAINCLDDQRIVALVRQLQAEGIETIVIGLATSSPTAIFLAFLRSVAEAGGASNRFSTPYLTAEIETQIEQVFSQSLLEPSYCDLQLSNGAQQMPDALVSGSTRVERGVRDGNGWDVDSTHPERIRLFGSLCRHAISERTLSWRGVWNQRCVMYP
ncbi:MAG: VWA domain-containing protein [Polyangiales bacterium]